MAKAPTLKAIRAKARQLGITDQAVIEQARAEEDPLAYLEVVAPADAPPVEVKPEDPEMPEAGDVPVPVTPISVDMPLGPSPDLGDRKGPYLARHVEVGGLTAQQRIGLYRLRVGLHADRRRLASGQPCFKNVDVIRWLLEQAGG